MSPQPQSFTSKATGASPPPPPPPHVLVFPFPAQGHMIPLLDLAHLLSLRGLVVTVLVTPQNLPLLRPLLSRSPAVTPLVLPFPHSPSLPPGVENTQGLPFSYIFPMIRAVAALREPLLRWVRSTTTPPDAILSDFFLGWTRAVADELGISRLVFCPSGALTLSVLHCLWRELPDRDDPGDEACPVAFRGIPNSPVFPWNQISFLYRAYKEFKERDPSWEFVRQGFLENTQSRAYVFNSLADLEAPYLAHIRSDLGHPRVWAVGPLLPTAGAAVDRGGPSSAQAEGVLKWLDARSEGEVVYVCFGSQAALAPPQSAALAAALERSGALFVWCVKEAAGEAVPEGFEGRTAGRGVVIRGWAPQVAILGHAAVGWFLTHCGWNSVLEGVAAGTALLTWPMTADQFMNARLLAEAGVGVRLCEGLDAVPDSDELAKVMAEAVGGARPERARALELMGKAAEAVREGGRSCAELGELVDELFKLGKKPEGRRGGSSF